MTESIRRHLEGLKIAAAGLEVETAGESGGHCACCGEDTRTVWGYVHLGQGETIAAYYAQWTLNRPFSVEPMNVDLILGRWGEGATDADRCAVSLIYFEKDDAPGVMVIDAGQRSAARPSLVGAALAREDVVGTPFAAAVFAVYDAIVAQDPRIG